jgi:prepilin-type N-terminal cleavage/methylation domain-containing protein
MKRQPAGFSFLEAVIVMAIMSIAAGIVFIVARNAFRVQRADSALQDVVAMTRTARQLAIDKRRVFLLTFSTSPSQMTLTVTPPANPTVGCAGATNGWPDSTPAVPTPVLGNFDFEFVTGAPTDSASTPDGLGATQTSPIYFTSSANPTSVCFYPDGSARDNNNQFTSGLIYLAPTVLSESNSTVRLNNMRAVTIFGPTGRISGWRMTQNGTVWKMW